MINKILLNDKVVNASIILMGISLLVFIMYNFKSFILPFVISILLTFVFVPLTRFRGKKRLFVWITSMMIVTGVILMSVIVIGSIFKEKSQIPDEEIDIENQNEFLNRIESLSISFGSENIDVDEFVDNEKIEIGVTNLIKYLINAITVFFSQMLIVGLFLLFILPSYDIIVENYANSLKNKKRNNFLKTMNSIESSVRKYLSFKSIISFITAILSGVIMFFFGVKFVFLFIFLTFFLNFIPSIGSIIAVGIVISSEIVFTGYSNNLLYLALLLGVLQFSIGNIIEPKLFGKFMSISPIIILLSLFFWGSIWGIAGMFFAVPLTVIIKMSLENYLSIKNN